MTKEMAINILRGDVLGTNEQTHEAVFMAIKALKEQSTLDAEPVRHGHWVPYEYGDETWHKCSYCGTADKFGSKHTAFDGKEHVFYSVRCYCPKCGAKMDEEEK